MYSDTYRWAACYCFQFSLLVFCNFFQKNEPKRRPLIEIKWGQACEVSMIWPSCWFKYKVNPEVNPHSTLSPYILPSLQFCILYLSITTRGLYIFNPLLIYVILCNKVLENAILIHNWYSIAVWNQERVMMAQVQCYECCSTRQESC